MARHSSSTNYQAQSNMALVLSLYNFMRSGVGGQYLPYELGVVRELSLDMDKGEYVICTKNVRSFVMHTCLPDVLHPSQESSQICSKHISSRNFLTRTLNSRSRLVWASTNTWDKSSDVLEQHSRGSHRELEQLQLNASSLQSLQFLNTSARLASYYIIEGNSIK